MDSGSLAGDLREVVRQAASTSKDNTARIVMEIVGHSQFGVTMSVSADVVQNTQREDVKRLNGLIAMGSVGDGALGRC